MSDILQLLKEKKSQELRQDIDLILEGQYKIAYEAMLDAYNAGLFVGLIGPVGSGKTALCRKFAYDLGLPFNWVTFSDLVRPSTLIGSLDPTLVFNTGFTEEAFSPGPFTVSALQGGVFLANELNRGDEYVLNTLLDALEEKKLYIPSLRTWYDVDDKFYMISAMNPSETRGTRKLPSAIKDRIKVWIHMTYPSKSTELKIVKSKVEEYNLPASIIEKSIELVAQIRSDPQIEQPASIRSSIGLARLTAETARRLQVNPDTTLLAKSAMLILPDAIKLKAGRVPENYIKDLCKRILGVSA
ncbi:MAG: MoxR family ATPase [Candidatus Heimdallarchaeota archaeon]|nr:MoxR family ATPase [Candidatus Heimdallarchaeota archaeon]MDH5645805.1 MoxR family ATPase [Candidatus Heimdallarchaeota archaeon]